MKMGDVFKLYELAMGNNESTCCDITVISTQHYQASNYENGENHVAMDLGWRQGGGGKSRHNTEISPGLGVFEKGK